MQTTPVGKIESSARVHSAISAASARTGIDFDYLYQQARVESNFEPNAKAKTSSATGLYQFTRQTWLATVKTYGAAHGLGWAAEAISQGADGRFRVADPSLRAAVYDLRKSPEAASNMAAEFASDNEEFLSARIGRDPEPVDLYLAHFLGAAGAAKFLTAHAANPNTAAAPLFAPAAAANRAIFFGAGGSPRSLDDIRNLFSEKLGQESPGLPSPALSQAPSPTLTGFQPQMPARLEDAPRPMRLLSIEPMPKGLSLDFAHRAYQRLAQMGGGREE